MAPPRTTGSVKTRDNGVAKLLQRLGTSGEVTVGVHADKGAAPKQGDDDGGMSVIDVAVIHEFGAEEVGIPRRSFIRDWQDDHAEEHARLIASEARAVVAGKLGADEALRRIGLRFQGEVQKRIAEGIDPPLAQRTINRKGSSKPLIDTGQLRASITNEVTVKK